VCTVWFILLNVPLAPLGVLAAWLCEFFGRTRATNDLLPHLITWLNDRDWQLRAAFFEHIVGAAVFLGPMPANQVCALVRSVD
jgi:hypothetical protein